MVNNATIIIRGFEETLAQKNAMITLKNIIIKRLQREINGERITK
jgi:hypothetical protein